MATDYTIPKDDYRALVAENAKLREENQSIALAAYELGRKRAYELGRMSDTDELLLRCIESLMTVVSTMAVILDSEGRVRPDEGKTINKAFSNYNSAHYDLLHPRTEVDDGA